MANYPQYNYQPQQMGYQPQGLGYQPQMQPVYQQPQYPAVQQPNQQEQFYCRPVASAEEARAVPVDFNGKPMLFPQLNAGRIYVKIFDPGSGSAIFREFRMVEPEAETQNSVAFAPMSELEGLRAMVVELQNELRAMKAGKRKPQQEVTQDEL